MNTDTKAGKFIVIDGTDGSGKTTQLNLLKEKLESEGYDVKIADFPQYNTKSAGMVEEYLSGKYGSAEEVDPYKASIFYAVDRFDASKEIATWLNQGKIVLANRYTSASLGHQGGKIENPLERRIYFNWLYDLEYKIFEIPRPDLTIVLHVEPDIAFQLAKHRQREDWKGKTNDIHEDDINHLKKAEQTYLEIASSLPGFKLVKCTHKHEILSPEAIHFLVWLVSSQIIKQSPIKQKSFQAIGNIIGSNSQIISRREAIINKAENKGSQTKFNTPNTETTNEEQLKEDTQITDNIESQIRQQAEELTQEIPEIEEAPQENNLKVMRVNSQAKLPTKAHSDDAGYDLYSNDYYSIPAYGQALVDTGIKMQIPNGLAGLIWDKSGLANEGITTMGGLIDANYRGEIKVVVKNLSEDIYNIVPGQKIAQIIFQKIADFKIEEANFNDKTKRNDNAFGSSGKF